MEATGQILATLVCGRCLLGCYRLFVFGRVGQRFYLRRAFRRDRSAAPFDVGLSLHFSRTDQILDVVIIWIDFGIPSNSFDLDQLADAAGGICAAHLQRVDVEV